MTTTACASKCRHLELSWSRISNGIQSQVSLVHGVLPVDRNRDADAVGYYILRQQSACGYFRAVHGHRCVFRSDGGHPGEGTPRIRSGFQALCFLRTRRTMHHAWDVRFLGGWCRAERDHASDGVCDGDHVRADRRIDIYPPDDGKNNPPTLSRDRPANRCRLSLASPKPSRKGLAKGESRTA